MHKELKVPSLVPYIYFSGRSREAVTFYKSVFGGDAEIQEHDGVVVQLVFSANGIHFMGSDQNNDLAGTSSSTGYSVVLNCDSEKQLRSFYEKLVANGQSVFEPVDGGWGAIVAHCSDQFGISWLLNYDK